MKSNFIFQTDHPLVVKEYENKNYKIIFDNSVKTGTCAIYFSSNNIYYPNNELEFKKTIIDNDNYEWYKTRIKNIHKHIYLRDIHKQWYLTGINSNIDTPEKLLDFLLFETKNCKVTLVGSSAGGYAAVLYGSLLSAEKIFSFNGQMELNSLLKSSSSDLDPLIFKLQNTSARQFYDLNNFIPDISKTSNIFYFTSVKSKWDAEQASHISQKAIRKLRFNTNHHGIPFLKCSLFNVINFSSEKLSSFTKSINNPIIFSIRCSGIIKVTNYLFKLIYRKFTN